IDGDLVLDDSLYDLAGENLSPLDGDASQPYNVAPDAALFNFKAVKITVRPSGQGAEIALDPALAGVAVINEVRVKPGACTNGEAFLVSDGGDGQDPAIRVGGTIHSACGEQSQFSAVLNHQQFVRALFKAAWAGAGGSWDGKVRFVRGAARGVPWLVWESPRSLAQVVEDIHKNSNNVMARQLLLQIGAEVAPLPATIAGSRSVVRAWLELQGLHFPELVLDNGAGLSRDARISAHSLARLLLHAASGPYADTMRLTLPLAGVDGTMKRRLVGEELTGRAWIKTGSLDEVRAIAGYVDAISGQRYVVVMIVNGAQAAQSRSAQDGFMRWVFANG
ncbi:MAG: D-alanyl-D-alanine carboxypeptidase/D-alanyl-D-alanine-endopeptidase, partial [Burkholderiaceae bacterium]|nr:D-alanyl-D-alanine carboxypeptidase/D-alanyl-D-alanine-endopeptidase [Burkholderiaceae bacterium]